MTDREQASYRDAATSSFATVAKRISVWTTNFLVSVLIVVVGVGIGCQVVQWWGEDAHDSPPPALPVASDALADPSARHFLEFGDQAWVMARRSVAGSAEEALAQLRQDTSALARQAELPADEPGVAEGRLLQRLAAEKPAQEEPGVWQVHEFGGPFPMMVGTRVVDQGGRESFSGAGEDVRGNEQRLARPRKRLPTPSTSVSGGSELAGLPRRVVTWGLGIPSAQNEWTLWTFHCGPGPSQPFPSLPELLVPPGAAKTLAVRVAGGGAMVGFRGAQEAESWKRFFDQWLRRKGWTVSPWCKTGSFWHLGGRSGVGTEQVTMDIQFGPQRNGELAGFLVAGPGSAPLEKDTHP